MYDVNIDRIEVSNKVPFGKKGFQYFIGCKDDHEKVISLCIMLPKTIAYRKIFDKTEYTSYLIRDNKLLEKYNGIWDKVSKVIKKGFDEPVYHEKIFKNLNKIL